MLSQQVCDDRCGLLSSKKQSQIRVTERHHPSGLAHTANTPDISVPQSGSPSAMKPFILQVRLETSLLTLTVFSDWTNPIGMPPKVILESPRSWWFECLHLGSVS